ncbi:MAG: alpha-hydroxy-acid oxidizing protein [Vicinamibacterales bacterium]
MRQARRDLTARVAPRDELVNVPEFEAEAGRVLAADVFRLVSGGDRETYERITFRPRMMVPCLDLDLSLDLVGLSLFAPIVVGPVAEQQRFHPDGELATVRGAGAGKAAVVVSGRSSQPVAAICEAATTPILFQVFATDGGDRARAQAVEAERAGAKAIVVTVDAPDGGGRRPRADWSAVEAVRTAVAVPVVAKGVVTPVDATTAVSRGARAIVVSNYGAAGAPGAPSPLEAVAPIVKAVGPDVPVLVDGGIRRGTDVMKALALGARAVLVARPAMWGLAAYGADGVQTVVELLQTELARVMGCCGTPRLAAITSNHVRVHGAPPAA